MGHSTNGGQINGLESQFEPKKWISRPFIWFGMMKADCEGLVGKEEYDPSNRGVHDKYLRAVKHFYEEKYQALDTFGEFLFKRFHRIERDTILRGLKCEHDGPDNRIVVDEGFRKFSSEAFSVFSVNSWKYIIISLLLQSLYLLGVYAIRFSSLRDTLIFGALDPTKSSITPLVIMILLQCIIYAAYFYTQVQHANRVGSIFKQFFSKIRELADELYDAILIVGRGVPTTEARAAEAGKVSKVLVWLPRRIEFGYRWLRIDAYEARINMRGIWYFKFLIAFICLISFYMTLLASGQKYMGIIPVTHVLDGKA